MQVPQYLISKRAAANSLGISIRKLDELIADSEIPVRRIGRRVLLSLASLERFANTSESTY